MRWTHRELAGVCRVAHSVYIPRCLFHTFVASLVLIKSTGCCHLSRTDSFITAVSAQDRSTRREKTYLCSPFRPVWEKLCVNAICVLRSRMEPVGGLKTVVISLSSCVLLRTCCRFIGGVLVVVFNVRTVSFNCIR